MKINLRFFEVNTPNQLGSIRYQLVGKGNRSITINSHHLIYSHEWNSYRNAVRLPRKNTARKAQLIAIMNEVKCDMMQIREIYDEFVATGEKFDLLDVSRAFRSQRCSTSLVDFVYNAIDHLTILKRHGTAQNYASAIKSFMAFRENCDIDLSEIDSDMMQRYEAHLIGRGVSPNTISFYMRNLRALYNQAVEQGIIPQRNPFRHVYTGIAKTMKRALPLKSVQRILSLDLHDKPLLDFARDMFMFSFYTRGMSFVDMAHLKVANVKDNILYYRRQKTGQQLQIRLEQPMLDIINKYREKAHSPYLLPICKSLDDTYQSYKMVMARVNKYLKQVGRLADIDAPLTMYVARHSWASVARDQRIPLSVISHGMGHDSEHTTQIYLASISSTLINNANTRILSHLINTPSRLSHLTYSP
ncbi:MAG: site-specific integrase [Muribaculaceae bacterium]|nr:site-specific integrase [Muribaculaceae bacterium]